MYSLAILFGVLVGVALGLTGGGGGVLAVPLLVYGLSIAPREAVGVSLASVGGTALFGAVPRLFRGQVQLRSGLLIAISGVFAAPMGNWAQRQISEQTLLFLFGALMFLIPWRMWRKGAEEPKESDCQAESETASQSPLVLVVMGLATGFLSGMLGVGGGFVLVPALVLFTNMPIHQAVPTSLLAITFISASGVVSHLYSGQSLSGETVFPFMLGGFAGLLLGSRIAKYLDGPSLQRVFSVGVVLVALFVISKSLLSQG